MSKIAMNAMLTHLKNFEMQYLNSQASDQPGSYVFFCSLFKHLVRPLYQFSKLCFFKCDKI